MKETIRVAGGQGFWGDLLTAPVDQVRKGPIDYLMLDYLAEVTMSILQKQRNRNPEAGYARDFVELMREILPDCVEKYIKGPPNAGRLNVPGCTETIPHVARRPPLADARRPRNPVRHAYGDCRGHAAIDVACVDGMIENGRRHHSDKHDIEARGRKSFGQKLTKSG